MFLTLPKYRGEDFSTDNLLYNANLAEFAYECGILSGLFSNGKVEMRQTIIKLSGMWSILHKNRLPLVCEDALQTELEKFANPHALIRRENPTPEEIGFNFDLQQLASKAQILSGFFSKGSISIQDCHKQLFGILRKCLDGLS